MIQRRIPLVSPVVIIKAITEKSHVRKVSLRGKATIIQLTFHKNSSTFLRGSDTMYHVHNILRHQLKIKNVFT